MESKSTPSLENSTDAAISSVSTSTIESSSLNNITLNHKYNPNDIFDICAKGDFEQLKKYSNESSTFYTDIDKVNQKKQTPLIVSLKNKKEDCAEYLVSLGCNINITDDEDRTALMYASYLGLSKSAKLLCYTDADVNLKDKYQRTALAYSAIGGFNSIFDFLIENGSVTHFELVDIDGLTPIMHASMNGHDRIVKKLLKLKTDLEKDDQNGKTPIHLAIEGGHEKIAKMLVDAGADVNKKDKDGRSTLMKAIVKDQKSIFQDLVKKVDINEKDNHGVSPLMVASFLGDKKAVELLVEKGANVNETNKDGQSALMLAAGINDLIFDTNNSCTKDLNDLLKKSESKLSGMDDLKEIADILSANKEKSINDVENELNLTWIPNPTGGDDQSLQSKTNISSINDPGLLNALTIIDPITGEEIFVPEEKSEPLDDLILNRDNLSHNNIITSLVDAKADVNLKDKDGRTALFYAAKNESVEAVNTLIDNGADITITDNNNTNLLGLLKELDDDIVKDKIEKIEKMVAKFEETKISEQVPFETPPLETSSFKETPPSAVVEEIKIIETFIDKTPNTVKIIESEAEAFIDDSINPTTTTISSSASLNSNSINENKFEINDRLNEVIPPKEDEKTELKRLLKFKGPTGQNILMKVEKT